MQYTETIKNNTTAYQYILDNYHLDTYLNILDNFANEYEIPLSDIQELMTYELYMDVFKESNFNIEETIETSFILIKKRLFLSDYDKFQPIGQITL